MPADSLKTVADADLIIVLRDGRVAEQGTHGELMSRGGLYRAMWDQQNSTLQELDEAEEQAAAGDERR